ncbi:MAG: site-2 protease family protein [Candidatus Nanohaloarchaea archaeon]|nr:site-2 protease family protein [Candidatus Nanohaloarchaea archaeon]
MNPITDDEMKDLAASTLGLGLAFAFLFFSAGDPLGYVVSPGFIPGIVAAMALVAISFLPHEMAHRTTARAINAYAEYRMWTPGVVIAVLSSIFGFVFAAPGGVEIYTRRGERYGTWEDLKPRHIGIISIVGPLINVSMAVIFAFLAQIFTLGFQGHNLLALGADLNSFLAVFNLLPFYPMDGYKVLRWNILLWVSTTALAVLTFTL